MTGVLRCGHYQLALDRPLVMGIVNVTPDSFFDGGRYADARAAAARARRLVEEGADLVDIGGESSRPGAAPVPADEELARVLPVLEALGGLGVPVSVDTTKPEVMREALARRASSWTPASVSARRPSTTCCFSRASMRSQRSAIRCWSACRGSRASVASPGKRSTI